MMINKIEKSNLDYRLIWIINEEYNLKNLVYIYDDYVLSNLADALKNHKENVQITLLGEVPIKELQKYYDQTELKNHLSSFIYVKTRNKNRTILCGNVVGKVVTKINTEDDLIEIIDNINNLNEENQLISYYFGAIKLKDLYRQFKGKDNFIKIIEHIRNIIGNEDKS